MALSRDPKCNMRRTTLSDAERRALMRAIEQVGETELARTIGVSRPTIARAVAGLPLYTPTSTAIRAAIAPLRAA